jgi:hypothetical protein
MNPQTNTNNSRDKLLEKEEVEGGKENEVEEIVALGHIEEKTKIQEPTRKSDVELRVQNQIRRENTQFGNATQMQPEDVTSQTRPTTAEASNNLDYFVLFLVLAISFLLARKIF